MKCPKCNGKCVRIGGTYGLDEVIKPNFKKVKQWRCRRCQYQFRENDKNNGYIDIAVVNRKKKRKRK
jgi:C4-type Zn-finger protein